MILTYIIPKVRIYLEIVGRDHIPPSTQIDFLDKLLLLYKLV